mgnify:CR=1 FL=1
MEMVLSLKDFGLILLFIAIVILIIYLIVAIKNLIVVLKKASSVLDDVNGISKIAANRANQFDKAIDNAVAKITSALTTIAHTLKKKEKAPKEAEEPTVVEEK